jgi:hypothetical protein
MNEALRPRLASLRFLAYAVVGVFAIAQLSEHGGSSKAAVPLTSRGVPRGSFMDYALSGRTEQGQRVLTYVSTHGAEEVWLGWIARCPSGEVRGPFGLVLDDLDHSGSRFAARRVVEYRDKAGTRVRVDAHIAGRLLRRGMSAAGVVRIKDQVRHRGKPPMECGPGAVAWRAGNSRP